MTAYPQCCLLISGSGVVEHKIQSCRRIELKDIEVATPTERTDDDGVYTQPSLNRRLVE